MPDNICLLYFYIYLSKIWIKDVRCYESLPLKIQTFFKLFEFKKFKKFKAKCRKFVLRNTFKDYSLQLIQTKKILDLGCNANLSLTIALGSGLGLWVS